ncbi:MAG: restriction endonuclease subunit S [Selenomonadaceae bacterium]|nr:restriction endonuclease subunit S [Selenomonadaceae bacterium]
MFWWQARQFMERRTLLKPSKIFAAKKFITTITTMTTNDKIWREFFIEEIFDILPGKRLTKSEMIAGDTPFIGASDSNNGVTAFVSNENNSADENFLSVSYNGSVCECFYQPYRCLCSDDVKRFHLKNHAGNKYIYLFLANVIKQQKGKYNYGYKFNESRMRRQKIFLPVTEDGSPDFDYMENYMRAIEGKLLQRYRDFVREVDAVKVPPFNEKIWRSFRLLDYFDFIKGNQKDMSTLKTGDLLLISAKDNNNGLKAFVTNNGKKIFHGHCLTLNNEGSGTGIAYYQPADFLLDSHVTALYSKFEMSRESMLFIATCIRMQRSRYGFGYSLTNARLNFFRLMLPVTEDGSPDLSTWKLTLKILSRKNIADTWIISETIANKHIKIIYRSLKGGTFLFAKCLRIFLTSRHCNGKLFALVR